MEGCRGIPRRGTVNRVLWRLQDRSKTKLEVRERLALRSKVNEEKHLREIYGVLREDMSHSTIASPTWLFFGGAIAESYWR